MQKKNSTQRKQGAAEKAADYSALAELLAAVLSHPDLPDCLEEAIGEGLNDVFNNLRTEAGSGSNTRLSTSRFCSRHTRKAVRDEKEEGRTD